MTAQRALPVDPALPRLPLLFDLPAMADELDRVAAAETASTWRVAGCEIERIKYRPRRNCIIGYRVLARRSGTGRAVSRRVVVAMYAGEEASERARRARAVAGDSVVLHPGLGAVVALFPYDRKLAALPLFASPRRLARELLPPLVRARFGADAGLRRVRTGIVSWFPEHTCTVRADIDVVAADGHAVPWRVYGHVRYDDASTAAFAAMQRLHGDRDCAAAGLGFARPLAYDAERRLLWQEGIDAPTLDTVYGRSRGAARDALCVRVTTAVAALHRTPLASSRLLRAATPADFEHAAAVVSAAVPACGEAARRVAGLLSRRAAPLAFAPIATLHGDLHTNNVLVDARRVHLIDLDRIGRGDPLQELGSLLAEWVGRECLAGRRGDSLPTGAAIEAYRRAVAWPCPDAAVRYHVAAALLGERALRAVTSLKPGRIESLPLLLDAAAALLGSDP